MSIRKRLANLRVLTANKYADGHNELWTVRSQMAPRGPGVARNRNDALILELF